MLNRIFLYLTIAFLFLGCKEQNDYLFYEKLPLLQRDDREYPLSLLQINNAIDVVLVIDNSASMRPIQNSVVRNAKLFFEQFGREAYVDWKIGIISTDKDEDPFLGFDKSFDSSLIDPDDSTSFDRVVSTFQNAVSQLGINGSPYEFTFYNLKRMLDRYPRDGTRPFLRDQAHLVTIMISDEKEQSKDRFGNAYEALNFLETMKDYIDGSRKLRFYGAIKHKELRNCSSGGYSPWKGSEFDKIITASEGFVVSACVNNFGNELARIGKDITTLVGLPSLLLRRRPLVETLQVYYEDVFLPPGPIEEGGIWFYEEITNTINFYNLDFVKDVNNDKFRIEFDVDDGVNRED